MKAVNNDFPYTEMPPYEGPENFYCFQGNFKAEDGILTIGLTGRNVNSMKFVPLGLTGKYTREQMHKLIDKLYDKVEANKPLIAEWSFV
jgi:hypothetical protein